MSTENLVEPKDTINPTTGMPDITDEEKEKAQTGKAKVVGLLFPWVFIGVGVGIAFGVYSWGNTVAYNTKIDLVNTYEMQWAYLSAFVFSYMVTILNFYPMGFKSLIMRGKSGNMRSNMFIYKNAAEGSSESRVVLASEGDEGLYNRANRSLYHFVENSIQLVLAIALCSFVFPFPTFILTVILFFARLIYTTGYTSGGYGGHVPGFILVMIV